MNLNKMQEKYLQGIYYRKSSFSNKKKTLILIHGLSSSSSAWFPYEKELIKRYNILSLDLRGHGKSIRPKKYRDYKIHYSAKDIYDIIKKEKISRFTFVSHSFANFVTLEFLREYPDLADSVIFVSPDYAPGKRFLNWLVGKLLILTQIADYFPNKKYGGHTNYEHYVGTSDYSIRRNFQEITNTGLKSYFYFLRRSCNFNAEDFLPKINIPVLIIHGDKDTIIPISCSIKMAEEIKNSRLSIVKGADHLIVLNWEKRLIKEINSFMKR